MGKACPFSSSAIQNLIIIAIFKLMALRDTLVYESVHLLILVCSFQWCVLFLCLAKLYRSCPIRDKGLLNSSAHISWHALSKTRAKDFETNIFVHRHLSWRFCFCRTSAQSPLLKNSGAGCVDWYSPGLLAGHVISCCSAVCEKRTRFRRYSLRLWEKPRQGDTAFMFGEPHYQHQQYWNPRQCQRAGRLQCLAFSAPISQ